MVLVSILPVIVTVFRLSCWLRLEICASKEEMINFATPFSATSNKL